MLLINVACFVSVARDRATVREVAHKIIAPGSNPEEIVAACMNHVYGKVRDNSDATVEALDWWTRLNYKWNPRRIGPATILVHGTHHIAPCQSHGRAMLALVEAHGLSARAIALHFSTLRGTHGIVEVDLGTGKKAVVDPQYGIIYRHPDGRIATLNELRADSELAAANQKGARRQFILPGEEILRFAYPVGEDGYGFEFPAYCNYRDLGPLRWWARDTLNSLFGESGFLIPMWPKWYVLWPAYNLLFAFDFLVAVSLIFLFVVQFWRRRRRPANPIPALQPVVERGPRSILSNWTPATRGFTGNTTPFPPEAGRTSL